MPVSRDYQRLENGLQVLSIQQPWAGRVGICLQVAAGSHDEPRAYPGLAHFLEHLLFLGSAGYSAEQGLMAYVQGCGGQVNASTQARHTDFVCEVEPAHLLPVLQRLFDMLLRPGLALEDQRREREVLQAEYLARSRDPDSRIDHALAQALAVGHPASAFLAGNHDSLSLEHPAFQRALYDFHRQHYQPHGMRLVVVGPQPAQHLLASLEPLLCAAGSGKPVRRPPPSLLPLRAAGWQLQQAPDGVHLVLAIDVPARGLNSAVQLLLSVLHDPGAGGLLDLLRQRRQCRHLQGRVLYRHAGQCLLRVDFPGASAVQPLHAMLLGWLRHMVDHPGWVPRLRAWRQNQALRQTSLPPLELARDVQQQEDATDEQVLLALQAVLRQLAGRQTISQLQCSAESRPMWPAVGLALPLVTRAVDTPEITHADWGMPATDTLLHMPSNSPRWPSLQLDCHPSDAPGGPAALYLRGPCNAEASPQATLTARLADLQRAYGELGVTLSLDAQRHGWTVSLRGAANVLPGCVARLLPLLLAPITEVLEAPVQSLLLRHLLQRLPDIFAADEDSGLQALAVGLDEAQQRQLTGLFSHIEPLRRSAAAPPVTGDLHWHVLEQPGEEAALLLFCPLADASPHSEAAWRLLGQLWQQPFHARLRGELQLSYAVFCGFRHIQGQGGLLFGVQSPHCDCTQLFAHVLDFVREQDQRLAAMSDEQLQATIDALSDSLAPATDDTLRAEKLWQAFLCGHDDGHRARLLQAIGALTQVDLLAAHGRLLDAQGGWQALASQTDAKALRPATNAGQDCAQSTIWPTQRAAPNGAAGMPRQPCQ